MDPTVEPSILVAAHRHREALAALDRAGGDTSALRLVRVQALLGLEPFRAAQELCKKVAWDPASTRSEQLHAHVLGARVLLRNLALVDEALELAVEAAAAATRNSARAGEELSELAGAAHLEAAGFATRRIEADVPQLRRLLDAGIPRHPGGGLLAVAARDGCDRLRRLPPRAGRPGSHVA